VEVRGVLLENFGRIELGEFYSSNEILPLNREIRNFGLIFTDKLYNHLFYESTNLVNHGVISSSSDLAINCPLMDNGGIYAVNIHSDINFATGIYVPPYQSSEYYGGLNVTNLIGSFNGTTLTGEGIYYISSPPVIYEEGLYISANVVIDYLIPNEQNIIYSYGNIVIYRGSFFVSGSLLVANTTNTIPQIILFGNLDVADTLSFATNATIVLYTGATLKISNTATLTLLNNATIQYCGGNLVLEGSLAGNVVDCPFNYFEQTFDFPFADHYEKVNKKLASFDLPLV